MEKNAIVLWSNSDLPVLPKKVHDISELVNFGLQLSSKDDRLQKVPFLNYVP